MFDIIELVASLDVKLVRWLLSVAKRTEGFSTSELFILWKIHKRNEMKISELSRDTGMPPSTLTGVIDRFEEKGYVERKHDLKDRRSVLIKETAKLGDLIENWKNAVSIELNEFCSSLPEGYMDTLRHDLEILQGHLDIYREVKENGRTN